MRDALFVDMTRQLRFTKLDERPNVIFRIQTDAHFDTQLQFSRLVHK